MARRRQFQSTSLLYVDATTVSVQVGVSMHSMWRNNDKPKRNADFRRGLLELPSMYYVDVDSLLACADEPTYSFAHDAYGKFRGSVTQVALPRQILLPGSHRI